LDLLKRDGHERNFSQLTTVKLNEEKKKVELETNARIVLQQYVKELQQQMDDLKSRRDISGIPWKQQILWIFVLLSIFFLFIKISLPSPDHFC
jgi:hypothetical protein